MLNKQFVGLKWKFALLFSSVLIVLQILLTYLLYAESTRSFYFQREETQRHNIHIANALLNKSAMILEQLAETVLSPVNTKQTAKNIKSPIINILDSNWDNWQYIWDLKFASCYDANRLLLKDWGISQKGAEKRNSLVLQKEQPLHSIVCYDQCYSIVTVPVMDAFQVSGTLSLGRTLADSIIEYQNATDTDIGILTPVEQATTANSWPYILSAITHSQLNQKLFKIIRQRYSINDLIAKSRNLSYQSHHYNVKIFPVEKNQIQPALFIIIDDVTHELEDLYSYLNKIIISGLVSMMITMLILFLLLHKSLKRVHNLSNALPLLARHRYQQFRYLLQDNRLFSFGYDEIDKLQSTSCELSNQLEALELNAIDNNLLLTQQSQELKIERDFSQKLVETAPIIILTQNTIGEILSINQQGLKIFEMDRDSLKDTVFDDLFPNRNKDNWIKFEFLRNGETSSTLTFDEKIVNLSGNSHQISWLHSIVYIDDNNFPVILTVGLDISERKVAEEQMLWMATHDQLTNLSNRRHFNNEFEKILKQASRYNMQVALYYLDLDQFKIINDTQGHHQGDLLLKNVAESLNELIRETDLLCRVGGDEFTIVVPDSNWQGIVTLALKINKVLSKILIETIQESYKVSTSIGIAVYPENGSSTHELLANADLAMYKAKESGFGQFHVFSNSEEYQIRLTKKIYWKNLLEEAINHDNFVMYYQPIINLQDNRVTHYECLIRIKIEGQKLIMPGEFIEYAEELGMIGQIDKLVMNKAIEKHLEFQKYSDNTKLAINLSGKSLNDRSIHKEIQRLLSLPNVKPENIIFELTETAAISNFNSAQLLINDARNLGCKFALDDFGVGFASFSYLKNLSVDYIKIDGSFIKKINTSHEDKIFVKAISDVSHALGKKTIAEFVENEQVLEILKEYKIDYAQGYHIGKPAEFIDKQEFFLAENLL